MGLTFDADSCYRALCDKLIDTMNQVMDTFYKEAISGLSAQGKADTEIEKAKLEKGDLTVGNASDFIVTKAKFYADAIVESYGTGSLSDTGPLSYWDEYMKNNPNFNPARDGKYITGRPRGSYTDIWGNKRQSSGSLEGLVIEGDFFNKDGTSKIKPISPSHSIQNAEKWVIKDGETRVERYLEIAVNDFFANEAKNFFVYV